MSHFNMQENAGVRLLKELSYTCAYPWNETDSFDVTFRDSWPWLSCDVFQYEWGAMRGVKTMGSCGQFSWQRCDKYIWTINLQSPDAQLSCSRLAVFGGNCCFLQQLKRELRGEHKKGCRCYERLKAKTWGSKSLAHCVGDTWGEGRGEEARGLRVWGVSVRS